MHVVAVPRLPFELVHMHSEVNDIPSIKQRGRVSILLHTLMILSGNNVYC